MYTIGGIRFMTGKAISEHITSGNPFPVSSFPEEEQRLCITLLLEDGQVEQAYQVFDQCNFNLDLYELDSFYSTLFSIFINSEILPTEETAGFFLHILEKTENINEVVGGKTLMHYFLDFGADPLFVQCLIDGGCNVNYTNSRQENYLHIVLHRAERIVDEEKRFLCAYLLVGAGIDIHHKNSDGNTPLIVAVRARKLPYVHLLMDKGADANEPNREGCTAFYYATHFDGHIDIFNMLCHFAAPDFDLVNRYGETYFLAFMKSMSGRENEMELLPRLIEAGASLSDTWEYRNEMVSGIHFLAQKNAEVLKFVLDAGYVNIHEKDNQGNTLLHKVCSSYIGDSSDAAKDVYKKVKMLLAAGADASDSNDNNDTPLMLAMQDDMKTKTVELLLKKE